MTIARKIIRAASLLLLLTALWLSAAARAENAPVQRGIVDLSSSANAKGITTLAGEWTYVWQQLKTPGSAISDADGFYQMPNKWTQQQEDISAHPSEGYASFGVTLLNIPRDGYWGISVPEQSTAFRLYLDDRLIASGGEVATSRDKAVPYSGNQVFEIGAIDSSAQLILHVSNFHHNRGGPWQPLRIGPYNELNKQAMQSLFKQSLVLALTFIAGFFSLTQWLIDRREKTSLLLFFLALVASIRIGIFDNQPLYTVFGSLPWSLHIRTVYLSQLIGIPLVLMWIQQVYPQHFNKQIVQLIMRVSALSVVFVSFTDPMLFSALNFPVFYSLMAITMLYALYGVIKVVYHRESGGICIAIGTCVMCFFTGQVTLVRAQAIESQGESLLPIGVFVFLLSLMVNLINQRSIEKKQVESLSEELLQINHTLETHVEERTRELAKKATALEEANEQLQLLANSDALTQLLNRRAFIEQCKQIAESSPTVSVVLIDVDHFKQVNDQFGHAAGDEVLVKLADLLRAQTRHSDKVARFGGEEFVLLLCDADRDATIRTCERIVESVRELKFDNIEGLDGVTISAGIVSGVLENNSIYKLIQHADGAMYNVKDNGRDGYRLAS